MAQTKQKQDVKAFSLAGAPVPRWKDARTMLERWLLERALAETEGNMAAAGRLLGITKVAVLHAVRRHDLRHLCAAEGK